MDEEKDNLLESLNNLRFYMDFIVYRDIDVEKTKDRLDKLIHYVEKEKEDKYLKGCDKE